MKNNVIALAVAAAIAAPMAASADATIYGRMHLDFANVDNGDDSTLAITSNASRVGFKGTEDLGGGLKAIWQVESQIGGDGAAFDGGKGWASRNTFVGLSGGWGTAILGQHDTPYKLVGRKVDFFGDQYGDNRAITNQFKMDARAPNVIAYISPNWGGFGIKAAYHTDNAQDAAGSDGGDAYSLSADYKSDMFWVGAAYQDMADANAITSGVAGGNDGVTAARIAGYVKLAGFKISADYTAQTAKKAVDNGGSDLDLTTYTLGASYTIGGKHVIKGQYTSGEADAAAGTDPQSSTASIGYDYKLSKKTTAGAFYSMIDNNETAQVGLFSDGGAGKPVVDGKDPSAAGVYMKMNF
jgi:predicted porin